MERKGTKLYRLQREMFRDAFLAQQYYEENKHHYNDRAFTEKQLAIYEELSYLISMMGWTEQYNRYCREKDAEYEKSLKAQALSQN